MKDTVFNIVKIIQNTGSNEISTVNYEFWTLLVTVILFVLGYIINGIFKRIQIKKELKTFDQTVINWIDRSLPDIKSFLDAIEKYLQTPKVELQPTPIALPILNINNLSKLEIEKYHRTFLLNRKKDNSLNSKCLYSILSQIEYLDKAYIEIQNMHRKGEELFELLRERNNAILVDVFYYRNQYPELKELNIPDKIGDAECSDLFKNLKVIITDENLFKIVFDTYFEYILINTIDLQYSEKEMEMVKVYEERIKISLSELENSVNRFRDIKLKPWYYII